MSFPLKLAVLLQDLEFGGTQRYAVHFLTHIDRNRFDPELWVLRGGDDMVPMAEKSGIKIVRLSNSSWVGPVALGNLSVRLMTKRPDILYTLTVVPNIWGRVMGRLSFVPAVVSGYRSLYPRQHEQILWRLSDRIICNANSLRLIMMEKYGVDGQRIEVIPNAVDTDFFRPEERPDDGEPVVLYLGRLVDDKDPVNLLRSFVITAGRVQRARFEIVGNGPYAPQLKDLIDKNGLSGRIRISAAQADVKTILQGASIFVMSSIREASPNVIIEAMAMGLPVAATAVGGIPELIEEGETGFLSPVGDPEHLSNSIVKLLKNESLRKSMGLNARRRAIDNHSLKVMVRRTEDVLADAYRPRSGKSGR